ncbi:hypothetical protein HNP55_003509 [Paucibacter oligotrophus]|uniref:Uncharacterized protein n=1 Tax=Roseateles oligotrophus TaxID=1769250 RepID=A0A840LE75_9BURK|nr:hypothetical protein [Roseateles oligotrophus]MBB4844963.1 hypothetical protein [Roseateles oligotrophus]
MTLFNAALAASPGGPQIQRLSLAAGQAQQDLVFELSAELGGGESRVVFAALRSTVPLSAIELLDPLQRRVWRKTPAQLGLTPRALAQHPELGEAIVLPELRLPQAGRWRLRLERAQPLKPGGQVLFSFRHLPRYELSLTALSTEPASGQVQNYVLRPADFGAPVLGLGELALVLQDASGQTVPVPAARERLRTPAGLLISDEPGAYISRFALPAAGAYRLRARQQFQGGRFAEAELKLEAGGGVLAAGAPLRLERIRLERQGECAQAAVLEIGLEVASPGLYAVTVLLLAGPSSRQLSRSAQLPAGKASLPISVPASVLRELGGPPSRIARLGLVRFGPDQAGPVAELLDLALSAEQQAMFKALCPG